jgi:hypothetical protein
MSAPTIQAFGQRHPIIVNPREIRVGDWMRDLGRLRRVESVEIGDGHDSAGMIVSVQFEDGVDGRFGTLSVCPGVKVTVWRMPRES